MSASVALLPIGPGSRNSSDARPHTAPPHQVTSAHPLLAASARPTHSLSRPNLLKINIDNQKKLPMPRRGTGNLALQARDSVAIRKRTLSTGAMSARAARQSARKPNAGTLQPATNLNDASGSGRGRPHSRSRSPAGTPSTRTDSHPKRRSRSRSPSPSSSSPSQSSTPITPGHPALSGAPSSFHTRPRTHVPHNSQGTTTSAYPASSSHSSRSSSPSPERSRTLSPLPQPQKASAPHTPALELDPDDVNARLRLLVNNSYFLPPAHVKPELSPIFLSPSTIKGVTSPSAFKEFFRVGKKKEKKSFEPSDFTSPNGRRVMPRTDSPPAAAGSPDGRYGAVRHGEGMLDLISPDGPTRNRVVVVRETVDDLPLPAIRAPYRSASLPTHIRSRTAPQSEITFIDPTTQYDVPPPTHFPSYDNLGLDAAGITGNVQLDQFVPPGEPWSPAVSRTSAMDSQERVWRRAILEQAVDLSLSSAASDPGHVSGSSYDMVFARPSRVSSDGSVEPQSPKSTKSRKGWWGRKDKDMGEALKRPSTSSSNKEREILRRSSEHAVRVVDISQATSSVNVLSKRNLGQRILPNVNTADLDELECMHALTKEKEHSVFPSPLRLPLSTLPSSVSTPTTPLHSLEPGSAVLPMTPLRPRPVRHWSDAKRGPNAFGDTLAEEFLPGHSTIKKSLSSPLLSDMHETGVNVEELPPLPDSSTESFDGVAAPSLVLRDPQGVTSLVNSNAESFITASQSDDEMFDAMMSPNERHFGYDDSTSLERWSMAHSNADYGDGRPSFDSFRRVRSPESGRPARASSTFGFRHSNVSNSTPSPLRLLHNDIEVDITGDPMEHLTMMEHQRSISPGGESQMSSLRGYASAVDHTFYGSETLSMRPASPTSQSFLSTKTRLPSINSQGDHTVEAAETESLAPISFFDSVQRQAYMDADGSTSESDADVDEPPDADAQTTFYDQRPTPTQTQTLGRKSLNTIRPAHTLTTQFRNASQPQLPLSRGESGALASMFRPYDLLDRKKPLSNTPISVPPVSSGILSQLKSNKGPSSFVIRNKMKGTLPVMLTTDSKIDLMRYPPGSTFSLASGAGTVSDVGHIEEPVHSGKLTTKCSLPSLRGSDAGSLKQLNSWRDQTTQDESLRKLDGMVLQHLEAEKDRLRKIATAARKKGGSGVDRVS